VSDVDAVTLSMTQLSGGALSPEAAALAILVAVGSNSLSKTVLGAAAGGVGFGATYGAVSIAALAAGGITAWATL
jgi:uncharacterized membrane protein (DUF4010 family)